MSLSNNFPVNSSNLNLSLANAGRLDPRVTFTRASTGTYYDGYSSAKAEENLLLQSQDFATSWTNTNTTDTANTTVAPDGTTTADTIVEDNTASAPHRMSQSVASSGQVTLSVFAKAGAGTRYLTIGVTRATTHYATATFDLAAVSNTQNLTAGYSGASASIVASTNGFYRCSLTVTTDTVSDVLIGLAANSTFSNGGRGFEAYTGDNTSSLIFWGAQLEQRSSVTSYTATTTAPITNYIPVLQTAAADVPRFDHNPTTRAALGLLVEEQRANLLTYSEDFADASWTKSDCSITSSTIVSPGGTLTGSKLVENANNADHQLRKFTATIGTVYTISIFAKKAERSVLYFAGILTGNCFFDLNSGTVVSTATWTSASITNVGNGWYRCIATATAGSTGPFRIGVSDNTATTGYTGNGYSGIFLWGAQLEAGAFPTSYIATTTASVTRNADVASMTGTNFSAWYNASAGTFVAQSQQLGTGNAFIFTASDGTVNNRIAQFRNGATLSSRVVTGGSATNPGDLTIVSQAFVSSAIAATAGAAISAASGTLSSASTPVSLPTIDRLGIGVDNASATPLNGYIRRLAYYPVRNSDAQLQALTG